MVWSGEPTWASLSSTQGFFSYTICLRWTNCALMKSVGWFCVWCQIWFIWKPQLSSDSKNVTSQCSSSSWHSKIFQEFNFFSWSLHIWTTLHYYQKILKFNQVDLWFTWSLRKLFSLAFSIFSSMPVTVILTPWYAIPSANTQTELIFSSKRTFFTFKVFHYHTNKLNGSHELQ